MIKYTLLLCLFFCVSCQDKEAGNDPEGSLRIRYYNLQDIGWKSKSHVQKAGEINYAAAEVPIVYYLLKDQGHEDLLKIDSLYEQNKTERIIEFSFTQDEEKDILRNEFTGMPYDNAVKYMSFELQKDFYVVTSRHDTIPCAGTNFERSYKIAPYQKVMLFFSGIKPGEELQLVYNDRLFGNGTLKFKFKNSYTKIAL
ncbi:MAG TPA: hypothetical protein VGB50_11850 [Flavobacterium sp.]|jgi:hypothetical protein